MSKMQIGINIDCEDPGEFDLDVARGALTCTLEREMFFKCKSGNTYKKLKVLGIFFSR